MNNDKPTFRNSMVAFQDAINAGKLTVNPLDKNYAGNYMYMHTFEGKDFFKNIDTRAYDVSNEVPHAQTL